MPSRPNIKRVVSRSLQLNSAYICTFGMVICMYALYVELSAEGNKTYRAFCDFNEKISCSKVFTSRYGRGFGLIDRIVARDSVLNQPNSVFGMVFYILQIVMTLNESYGVSLCQLGLALISNICSIYLGYILYTMGDFCVVCVTMYLVNFMLLICASFKLLAIAEHAETMLDDKKRS